MSYISVLMHWWPFIASIPHQHTLVCFLCIISPLFTFRIPNWSYAYLESIRIISRVFSLPPLCQISATLWRGGGLFVLLHLHFRHDSWSIFYHPSYNIPCNTHIFYPVKPSPLQHEVQRDWEADWRINVPGPLWGKDRLSEHKHQRKGTGILCR